MRNTLTGYDVGALLYCPANAHTSIADSLVGQRFPTPFSLAFCLEDTVSADSVAEAERILQNTLERISAAARQHTFFLPPIFVRVRSPQQLLRLAETYAPYAGILAGFILPKFFLDNCGPYVAAIRSISQTASYVYMPIFESAAMIPPAARQTALAEIREQLDTVSGSILNVRVGGNDLSHAFGLRRPVDRTIYDLRPVADILIDIVTTFGDRYVVSGPVWEYYSGEGWDTGLRRELEMDIPAEKFKGQDELVVRVANSMANRIAYMDKKGVDWKIFYNVNMSARKKENVKNGIFDASDWEPKSSGLLGPVTLTPAMVKQ